MSLSINPLGGVRSILIAGGIIAGIIYTPQALHPQQDLSGQLTIGSWYGRALPDDPTTSPFPEVVMTPTFCADGNMIANDSHEMTNPHATAHGNWINTGQHQNQATFLWLNLTGDDPTGHAGTFKVYLDGRIDPAQPDQMHGTLSAVLFPPGADPFAPNDAGGIPVGTFTIDRLQRIRTLPATPTQDLSGELAIGSWYGRALPDDPATSPFPEVVMTPTFLGDGSLIANDSHEITNPHATAHGNWIKTGQHQNQATFLWLNLTGDDPTGNAGTFKVYLDGRIDPDQPDQMHGTLSAVLFPPGADPFAPDDAGGIPVGTFTIERLQRIRTLPATPVQDLSGELAIGSWYGRALPDDPATSPFPEVVMTPTFLGDGNMIANDSHEITNPHATAHGNWIKTGQHQNQATFLWLNLTGDDPTGNAGTFKVYLDGRIDPAQPDQMHGNLSAVLFPPGADPFAPNDAGGIPVGTFTIERLQRIRASTQGILTAIEQQSDLAPDAFVLDDAYPNPFNPSTNIRFSLPRAIPVSLRIFNAEGQLVRTLLDRYLDAGVFSATWDGTDDQGLQVSSGVYLYQIQATHLRFKKKVTLIK